MTPDQIALANLDVAKLQLWVTGLAIFLGPLVGVIFTFWFQSRKDRAAEKHRLFLTLMGDRKALVISQQMAQALNTIDVVFSDSIQIRNLWHEYYALLHQPAGELKVHKWLELLAAIAEELHYSHLPQTDLDKFYIPQGHADQLDFQREVQSEWLRVLRNTERFVVEQRSETKPQPGVPAEPPAIMPPESRCILRWASLEAHTCES
jgi:hypothetical protein